MKLKKGDTVKLLAGKDKGKEGRIDKILPKKGKVLVAGVNAYKKHVKPRQQGGEGGILTFFRPIEASSVLLICPKCKERVRVGYKITENGKKRFCRECGKKI